MPGERGHLGQDHCDRTAGTGNPGHSGKDSRDRTVGTGQSRQVGVTGQPGLVSLDRTKMTELPGNDSGVRRAVDKVAWGGQLEQKDSYDRTAGTGQTGQDRTSWTEHRGLDN